MNKPILTEDNFDELYRPIKNHLEENASFDGTMFETFGPELQYVLSFANDLKRSQRVWTIVEADGSTFLIAGYHIVNRLGYIITEVEWTDEDTSFQYEDIERDLAYEVTPSSYKFWDEWYDLIRYQFNLPEYSSLFHKNGAVKDEYLKYFDMGQTYTIQHDNIRIHDKDTAEIFLTEDSDLPEELVNTLLELIYKNPIFELKGDGDGLGIILDVWADLDSYNYDEPVGTFTFWLDDFI